MSSICEKAFNSLKTKQRLSKKNFLIITGCFRRYLKKETNVIHLKGEFIVIGDVHGQFYDLLNLLSSVWTLENYNTPPTRKILFLGDLVDRGYNSIEVFLLVMALKISYPDQVFVVRGNHETNTLTRSYGFMQECILKYDKLTFYKTAEIFPYIPMAAVINEKYFCVHGGLVPNLNIEMLETIDRLSDRNESLGIFWSDPKKDIEGFAVSERGAGYHFGRKDAEEFLKRTGFQFIVRSHELVNKGIEEHFDGKCITVWSAPNYMYRAGNVGATMLINETGHTYDFFKPVEVQYTKEDMMVFIQHEEAQGFQFLEDV